MNELKPLRTIDDANLVRNYVAHLKDIRKTQDYLANHSAEVTGINLKAQVHVAHVPENVRHSMTRGRSGRSDGGSYEWDSRGEVFELTHVTAGKFNPHITATFQGSNVGRFTLNSSIMDALRAAVDDEVAATEKAIEGLGYEVPEGESTR
jgi:hypothetical protein